MKILLFVAALLAVTQAQATNKCEVEGKIVYQAGPCVGKAVRKPITGGTFSTTGAEGLKQDINSETEQMRRNSTTQVPDSMERQTIEEHRGADMLSPNEKQ